MLDVLQAAATYQNWNFHSKSISSIAAIRVHAQYDLNRLIMNEAMTTRIITTFYMLKDDPIDFGFGVVCIGLRAFMVNCL